MGVPSGGAAVGSIMATKLVSNEFVAILVILHRYLRARLKAGAKETRQRGFRFWSETGLRFYAGERTVPYSIAALVCWQVCV